MKILNLKVTKNMKKTKILITTFAVFASILMLMTPTMARPVQEKTTIDAVEYKQEQLVQSLESLNLKLSKDVEFSVLLNSLANNKQVNYILRNMQTATSDEEIMLGLEQLSSVLNENKEYIQIENILASEYQLEVNQINDQLPDYDSNDMPDWLYNLLGNLVIIIWILISIFYPIYLIWLIWQIIFGNNDGGETPGF